MSNHARNPFNNLTPAYRRLLIFGAGGSGRETTWLLEQTFGNLVKPTFVVDQPQFAHGPVDGVPVKLLSEIERPFADARFIVAIGNPALRRTKALACEEAGFTPATLVHPRVEMSNRVNLGQGVVVCAGSILTTNIDVGHHVQINIGCTISHDVTIGDFTTLSPGVHVAGNVVLGRDVFVGVGACIINGSAEQPLTIGNGATIAAGACVTSSVPDGALVAGVPAVRKR